MDPHCVEGGGTKVRDDAQRVYTFGKITVRVCANIVCINYKATMTDTLRMWW